MAGTFFGDDATADSTARAGFCTQTAIKATLVFIADSIQRHIGEYFADKHPAAELRSDKQAVFAFYTQASLYTHIHLVNGRSVHKRYEAVTGILFHKVLTYGF